MAMAGGTSTKPMVIIGGSKAGHRSRDSARRGGFGGPVMIITGEPGISTGRPLLSKTYLPSEEDFESWYVKPADWYAAHGVELLAETAVTATDPPARSMPHKGRGGTGVPEAPDCDGRTEPAAADSWGLSCPAAYLNPEPVLSCASLGDVQTTREAREA
jgi:hypothetical protein